MNRLAWLLLVMILALSTVGFSLPAASPAPASTTFYSPPAMPEPAPAAFTLPAYNVVCQNVRAVHLCAWVSDARVLPGSFVTIFGTIKLRGDGIKGQLMTVVWHAKSSASCIAVTDENGFASCTTYVPTTIVGTHKVYVQVNLDKYKVMTAFRTKGATEDQEPDE